LSRSTTVIPFARASSSWRTVIREPYQNGSPFITSGSVLTHLIVIAAYAPL
jgi:hypothetical protein